MIVILGSFIVNRLYGQNEESAYYKWYDNAFGLENTGFYNGYEYREQIRGIDENHKFLDSLQFQPGTVVYNGQTYYSVPLKYDVYNDLLVTDLQNSFGIHMMVLRKRLVAGFSINEKSFTSLPEEAVGTLRISGFAEVLYKTDSLSLLKKHIKIKKDRIEGLRSYVDFENDARYILFFKNSYHLIRSRRDIIDLFPEYKAAIKEKAQGLRRKLDADTYWLSLIKIIASDPSGIFKRDRI
jgi:hypothetical protein